MNASLDTSPPPRRHLGLRLVPHLTQPGQRPRQRRRQQLLGHTVRTLGRPLIHDRLHPGQRPVMGDAGRPGMREHGAFLTRGQVQSEPVRLNRLHARSASPVGASIARRTRSAAARRPYRRTHNEVRANRSRCSATIVDTTGSRRRARNPLPCPFERGPHVGHHPVHGEFLPGGQHGDPGDLPVQVRLLLGRRHPGVHHDLPRFRGRTGQRFTDNDEAPSRYAERATSKTRTAAARSRTRCR